MTLSFVDDINLALDSANSADPELLSDIAAEYSEAVVAVNQRLRDISRLLERGHRSEALQMAELDPPVLGVVARLDFPRLDEWVGLLLNLDMETPPLLNHELAELIDNAYTDHRPIEELLRRHRALAIAKAPLDKRIHILSQLLKSDPGNAGWTEDLERWQTARLHQIRQELAEAKAAHDFNRLQALDKELQGNWAVPVPRPLAEEASKLKSSFELQHARKRLEDLLPELDAALSAHDVSAGRSARERWREYEARAALEPGSPVLARAEEALAWLEVCDQRDVDERDYQVAIYEVEQSIEGGEKLAPFLRKVHAFERLERPWPAILQKRVGEYRHALERSRKRNTVVAVVAGIALIALTAFYLFRTIQNRQHQRQLAESVNELSALHQAGNWVAAEDVYEKLSDSIRAEPTITSIYSQITTAREDARKRHEMFLSAFETAKQGGVETPDYSALDAAEKLIQDEEDRRQFDTFASAVRDRQNALLEERNQKFTEELAVFVEKVRELGDQPLVPRLQESIDQLATEITTWKSSKQGYFGRVPVVSTNLLGPVDDLLSRLQARRKLVQEALDEQDLFLRFNSAIGDAVKFQGQLESFCNTKPNHRLVADFQVASADLKTTNYMDGFQKWKAFLNHNDWALASDPVAAGRLLAKGNELLKSHPSIWLSDRFNASRPYLESAVNANGAPFDELKSKTKGALWDNLGLIVLADKDGKPARRFYLPGEPQKNDSKQGYFMSLDFVETKRIFPPDRSLYSGLAPHRKAVERIRIQLGGVAERGWQATFLDLTDQISVIFKAEEYAEPLVFLDLLKYTLEAGGKGDFYLKTKFQAVLDQINAIDRVDVDWIAANHGESPQANNGKFQRANAEARRILESLSDYVEQWKADPSKNNWQKPGESELELLALEPLAWLLKNADDTWTCSGLPPGIPDQQLYCMISTAQNGGQVIRPHVIGKLTDGNFVVEESAPRVAGRLVYGLRTSLPQVTTQSD